MQKRQRRVLGLVFFIFIPNGTVGLSMIKYISFYSLHLRSSTVAMFYASIWNIRLDTQMLKWDFWCVRAVPCSLHSPRMVVICGVEVKLVIEMHHHQLVHVIDTCLKTWEIPWGGLGWHMPRPSCIPAFPRFHMRPILLWGRTSHHRACGGSTRR